MWLVGCSPEIHWPTGVWRCEASADSPGGALHAATSVLAQGAAQDSETASERIFILPGVLWWTVRSVQRLDEHFILRVRREQIQSLLALG